MARQPLQEQAEPSPRADARKLAHVAGLDGLRGVAIAGVVLFHACATSDLIRSVRGGFLGVSLFFTLSGFLITSLLVTELQSSGRVRLGEFWSRRARRLLPASLAVTLTAAVLARSHVAGFDGMHAADVLAAVWSAKNWQVIASGQSQLLRTIVGPLGPYWSLAIEEQFYLALAVIVVAVHFLRRPLVTLAVVLGGCWVGSTVVAAVMGGPQDRFEFGTDTRMAELAAGALLALALAHWPALIADRRRLLDGAGTVALIIVTAMFLFADYHPPWLLHGGYSAVSILSVAVVAGVLARQRLERVLSTPPLVALGRISYSLYLVHWPIILLLPHSRTHLDGWASVALKIGLGVVVATALHLAIEQPLRRARRRPAVVLSLSLACSLGVSAVALGLP